MWKSTLLDLTARDSLRVSDFGLLTLAFGWKAYKATAGKVGSGASSLFGSWGAGVGFLV